MTILSVDIGTTCMKMVVFCGDGDVLHMRRQFTESYELNIYNDGLFADIEQEKWQNAFINGCHYLGEMLADVDAISLSGTTPGFSVMGADGGALYPAILMLDQRSRKQAQHIIDKIGIDNLLAETGNMPVAGGCTLASILWLKENLPEVYEKAHMFGHSNTFMARWLTGKYAIDPSSASLTALYNTVRNDMTWNEDIASTFGISLSKLPEIIHAYDSPGRILPHHATRLGFKKEPPVVIGGNDAVLAAYSLSIKDPGDIINVNGTCEITLVCLPKCYSSTQYNIRAHVIPDRWLTLYVMNAGGKALDWFRSLFCNEMKTSDFYDYFLPRAIDTWLDRNSGVTYVPYLMGSRYSQEPLKAEFVGMSRETTREELLAAMVRGLCEYQGEHLQDIGKRVPLHNTIHITGGAASPAMLRAKKKWMRNSDYILQEESSARGAALIGMKYFEMNKLPVDSINRYPSVRPQITETPSSLRHITSIH